MLAPKEIKEDIQDDEDDEKIQHKSAQVDLSESKSKQVKVDPEDILQKELIYQGQQTGTQLNNKMLAS